MLPTLRFVMKLIYHLCMWWQMLGSVNTDSLHCGESVKERGEGSWSSCGTHESPWGIRSLSNCPGVALPEGCREESDVFQIVQVLPCLKAPALSSYLHALSPAQPKLGRRTSSGFAKFCTNLFLLSTNIMCLLYMHTWWGSFYSCFILISSMHSSLELSKAGNPLYYTMPGNENKRKMNFHTFCLCASFILYIFSWCLLCSRNFAYYNS